MRFREIRVIQRPRPECQSGVFGARGRRREQGRALPQRSDPPSPASVARRGPRSGRHGGHGGRPIGGQRRGRAGPLCGRLSPAARVRRSWAGADRLRSPGWRAPWAAGHGHGPELGRQTGPQACPTGPGGCRPETRRAGPRMAPTGAARTRPGHACKVPRCGAQGARRPGIGAARPGPVMPWRAPPWGRRGPRRSPPDCAGPGRAADLSRGVARHPGRRSWARAGGSGAGNPWRPRSPGEMPHGPADPDPRRAPISRARLALYRPGRGPGAAAR